MTKLHGGSEFREEYALIEAPVRARTAAKLTQTELARPPGTTQRSRGWKKAGCRRRSRHFAATPKQPAHG